MHRRIGDVFHIRNVRHTDGAADQFGAAVADAVGKHFFKKFVDVAGPGQRAIAGFLRCQRLKTFGESDPHFAHVR